MEINFDNNIPIYVQLVDYLKLYIISGKFKSGKKLPSVRDLAKEIKVNPNTMQKALSELEELDLIYTERTNGKYVTNNEEIIKNMKDKYAKQKTKEFYESMQKAGLSKKEIINYLKMEGED